VIDKYIGDSVMAFWGAPFDTDKDEVNACLSAIQCLKSLDEINEGLRTDGLSELKVRIGIHTGEAIAGNIGSDRLFHYTVIGDTVNLASRLESANKFFKTSIIVSENTIIGTEDIFYKRELGSIAVKGKQLPVKIFELIGVKENMESDRQELLSVFQQGRSLYNQKKWSEAARVFDELLRKYPQDGPTEFYKRRCEYMISNPHLTEDWDVIKFTEK
jgi:adenylate cyclase